MTSLNENSHRTAQSTLKSLQERNANRTTYTKDLTLKIDRELQY